MVPQNHPKVGISKLFQASWASQPMGYLLVVVIIITERATAGIEITQVSNFAVFGPQGRHDSRINVKFGTAEGTFQISHC